MHRLLELVRLHRMGTGDREVARLLKMSPNTERRYRLILHDEGLLAGDADALPELATLKAAVTAALGQPKAPAQSTSSLAPWAGEIHKMIERDAGPTAIYDALRLQNDFTGSLAAVKRLCARLRKEAGVKLQDVAIPVETSPGEVAQVDFGFVGKLYDPHRGKVRKAWAFVMVLGFSRLMYVELVFDQKVRTWLDCHINAFHALGGVPEIVVPDNLKSAVIKAAFSCDDEIALNRSYRELARHYGFKIDPTPPRSPKHKGKVESGVKYVKNNFFKPRDFSDADISVAKAELARWLTEIANQRMHGTTGRRPQEVFDEHEKTRLKALPSRPFEVAIWKEVTVHRDSHVEFDKRLYSVPWRHIGKKLWVRATSTSVFVYLDELRVATHSRRGPDKRSTVDEHLPEERRDYRHRQRSYWEQRAAGLGDEVGTYIKAVFDSDDVLYQLRTVQNMVIHLETFPKQRARAACDRATYYSNFKYKGLKDILRKALDLQPLPIEAPAPSDPAQTPRFARRPSDIVNPNLELFDSSTGDNHGYQ